ncbi:unnamed protein product [Spirodela intermedia]|uniref:Uncharacterized protein n=1 Tax=Spirodela intermedia TaxID=51605 RepID=A0A7I8IT54_SPIIN|nr:unnamed protein product [Spirodela intermedia]CAA6661183.1 unnamed protein product [Spirodela intermedia]
MHGPRCLPQRAGGNAATPQDGPRQGKNSPVPWKRRWSRFPRRRRWRRRLRRLRWLRRPASRRRWRPMENPSGDGGYGGGGGGGYGIQRREGGGGR